MPSAEVPSNFTKEINLLATIKSKVDADGAGGPLVAMFVSKGIDLAADTITGAKAIAFDKSFKDLDKDSQNFHQQEKSIMKNIVKHTTGACQNLKSLFNPNFKAIGDWGGTITDTGKMTYPTTDEDWIKLLTAIKTKNDSYILPIISPLTTFLTSNFINLTTDAANCVAAKALHGQQIIARFQSQLASHNRNNTFKPVAAHIRSTIAYLKKTYPDNWKVLGEYGITTVTGTKAAKVRKMKIAFGQSKMNVKLVINSVIENDGKNAIQIFKGKTMEGTPIDIAVGGKWIVISGYSRVCIANSSATLPAQFTILPKA